jgi:hypothetical protein
VPRGDLPKAQPYADHRARHTNTDPTHSPASGRSNAGESDTLIHSRPHQRRLQCLVKIQPAPLVRIQPAPTALAYARERRCALEVYLSDADVPIDTNHLERTLRAIPMGRKNWLFSWTELGAKYIGIVQSLIVTCRLHQIDPYDYLVGVLQRVGQHPASQVHLLTPRLWKQHFAANPLRSALHNLPAKATTP